MASHRKTTLVAGLLATLSLLTTVPAQASGCWTASETAALKVRQMQVFLMVSALQCTLRGDSQMRAAYNRFAKNSQSEMQTNAMRLKSRWVADHGTGGQAQFDRYLTQLANNFSRDPSASSDCAKLAHVADQAAQTNAAGLEQIAAQIFPGQDSTLACTPAARLAGLKNE